MNFFITTITTIILATNFCTEKVNNEDDKLPKAETTKKHFVSTDKSVKPQVSTPIPATIVEEKYIAKVTTASGDTIRYTPIFVARKIKYQEPVSATKTTPTPQ